MVGAGGAMGVARDGDFAKPHAQGVVGEQTVGQQLADSQDGLDGLGGLERSDDAGHHAEDARL